MDRFQDSLNDYHSICLRAAAERRGISAQYATASYGPLQPGPVRWLNFSVSGREYLYCTGMLLMKGADPWGRLGRHVNEKAGVLIRDKHRAKAFLAERGFSVPAGRVFRRRDVADALRAFDDFSGPICVKPNTGAKGEAVTAVIHDRARYEAAVKNVAADHKKILVEQSVRGELIRFFYVRPAVAAVKLSRPASVVGDGASSAADLIAAKNALRDRRKVPGHSNIVVDDVVIDFLAVQGRSLQDVPAAGERVFLRGTSNGATGADSLSCRERLHPSYIDVIGAACSAVPGLNVTAADVVIRDPTVPAAPDNYWILELNRNPGLTPYHFPWGGESQDVSGAILDMLRQSPPDLS